MRFGNSLRFLVNRMRFGHDPNSLRFLVNRMRFGHDRTVVSELNYGSRALQK